VVFSKDRRDMNSVDAGINYCIIDSDAPKYKFRQGIQRLLILPTPMTNKKNPRVYVNPELKNTMDWDFEIWEHRGLAGGTYVCPSSYGMPCPVCESVKALTGAAQTDTEKKDADKQRAAHRAFFNILDLDDVEKGVQILETAAGYKDKPQFPQLLAHAQQSFETDADMQATAPGAFFPDLPNNGLVVKIDGIPDKYNGTAFYKPASITFVPLKPAEKEIAAAYLEKVIIFDRCIKVLSYEELEGIYTGDMQDDTDSDDEPAAVIPPVKEVTQAKPATVTTVKTVIGTPVPTGIKDLPPSPPKKNFWETDNDTKEGIPF